MKLCEPILRFDGKYAFLSNFYDSPVKYKGDLYANNEAAFQAAKCINPDDKIPFFYPCPPNVAKRMGRQTKLRPDWEKVKYGIMEEIVYEKFKQNSGLRKKLLETGDAELVEGNHWHDNVWGNCTCWACVEHKGANRLGKILMKVREIFQQEEKAH